MNAEGAATFPPMRWEDMKDATRHEQQALFAQDLRQVTGRLAGLGQ